MTSPTTGDVARYYRELLEINRLITSSLDLDVVLDRVTTQAAALLRAEAAALWVQEGGTLRVAAAHKLAPGAREFEAPLGPGAMTQIRDFGRATGLAGCVGVPLVLNGKIIGVLAVYRGDTGTAGAEDEELLSALADQAAVAIENARIYQQLHAQTEALHETETRFRMAFEEAPIGVALVGLNGRFLRVNNVLCEIMGYSREELTALSFQDVTYPDDVDPDVAAAQKLVRAEIPRYQRGERCLRKDGTILDIQLNASVVRDSDGAPLYFISQIEDVTERKRVEAELRRSEAQFRGFIERMPDGVYINLDGHIAYANQALTSLLGYGEPAEFVGKSLDELYHPDDVAIVLERARERQRGRATPPLELRLLRRDGSVCHVETAGIQVHFEDRLGGIVIVRDLAHRRAAEREREDAYQRLRLIVDLAPAGIVLVTDAQHCYLNARAQKLFGQSVDGSVDTSQFVGAWLDASEKPLVLDQLPTVRAFRGEQLECVEMCLRQQDGRLVPILVSSARIPGGGTAGLGAAVVLEDISALKDLERLRIEWSTLIAHDLRQPLSSIELYTQLIARKTASDPALQRTAQQISTLVRRLSRMVKDLVDFTRLEARQLTLDCHTIDLAELVRDTAERVELEAPDRPIEIRLRGAPFWVDVDADRMAQVVENLLSNAVKYGDPRTPIRIEVKTTAADRVSASVTNQGSGIAPEQMPYLFGRFQRARDAQRRGAKGIGLGLYVTRELIEAHRGQIVAESVPGGATTFRFTLPLHVAQIPDSDHLS